MSTPLKSVLVFGATGVIGKYITAALIEASFDRLAIFTSPSTLSNKAAEIQILKSKGVEIIIGDVTNKEDVLQAYNDNTGLAFDTVVSCVGRNVIKAQIDLIKWAEESAPGIKHFFPSEYGTDIEYGPKSAAEKPHQAKLAVRAYIRESVRRLEYTYLVTGPYADLYIGVARANPKAGTFDVKGKKATLLGTGEESVSLTTMKDVGRLLVAAVRNPAASRNRALIVNSFTTTPNEILSEFERQTASKWSVDYTPLDELKGVEEDAWANGDAHATGITLRRIWTEGGTLYKSNDNGVVNVSPSDVDTLADAVSKAVAVASGG